MKNWLIFLLVITVPLSGICQNFPYQLSSYKEAALIVPGSALMITSAILHNTKSEMDAADILKLDRNQLPLVDRFTTGFWEPQLNAWRENLEPASVILAGVGIGMYGLWSKISTFEWEALKTLMIMYLEGAYLANGAMLTTKILTARPRPYTYNSALLIDERVRGGEQRILLFRQCHHPVL